jgi:hypothetical protein
MFFTREVDTFDTALEVYRPCFTKPQWNHFITYLTSPLLGEKGEKNIQDIAGNLLDGGHQSSLNRFITRHRRNLRQFNAVRLRECLHDRTGGILSLDGTLFEKTGKMMAGVSYLYDSSQKRNVLCHDIVSTFYRGSTETLPLYFEPYVKKEITENSGMWFRTKIQIALITWVFISVGVFFIRYNSLQRFIIVVLWTPNLFARSLIWCPSLMS